MIYHTIESEYTRSCFRVTKDKVDQTNHRLKDLYPIVTLSSVRLKSASLQEKLVKSLARRRTLTT